MIALNRMLKPRSRTDNTLVLKTLCYENGLIPTENKGFMAHQDAGPIFMHRGAPTALVVLSECGFSADGADFHLMGWSAADLWKL